jgi:MtN3 and saliva related transmembrane protein
MFATKKPSTVFFQAPIGAGALNGIATGHWSRRGLMSFLSFVGALAAFCTTTSFIPQIVKIRKQGADDLSYSMLLLYLSGVLLWLVYGLLLHAAAIIWANAITSFLVALALALKATSRPMREAAGSDDDSLAQAE